MTKRLWLIPAFLALALLLALPLGAVAQQPTDPAAVVRALIDASNARDYERALAYYADDATTTLGPAEVFPPGTPLTSRGKDTIRAAFQAAQATNTRAEVSDLQAAGNRVTFLYRETSDLTRQLNVPALEATGEATVVNGRIQAVTLTLTPDTIARLQAAGGNPSAGPRTGTLPFPAAGGGGLALAGLGAARLGWLLRRRPGCAGEPQSGG